MNCKRIVVRLSSSFDGEVAIDPQCARKIRFCTSAFTPIVGHFLAVMSLPKPDIQVKLTVISSEQTMTIANSTGGQMGE